MTRNEKRGADLVNCFEPGVIFESFESSTVALLALRMRQSQRRSFSTWARARSMATPLPHLLLTTTATGNRAGAESLQGPHAVVRHTTLGKPATVAGFP